jgi:hypothetical protein
MFWLMWYGPADPGVKVGNVGAYKLFREESNETREVVRSGGRSAEILLRCRSRGPDGKSIDGFPGNARAVALKQAAQILALMERHAIPRSAPPAPVARPKPPEPRPADPPPAERRAQPLNRAISVRGGAKVIRAGREFPLTTGMELKEGDEVVITGDSLVALELADPANPDTPNVVKPEPGSTVKIRRLGTKDEPLAVEMSGSFHWFRIAEGAHSLVNVHLGNAILGLEGTDVLVAAAGEANHWVYVREGRVSLSSRAGTSKLPPGIAFSLIQGRPVGSRPIDPALWDQELRYLQRRGPEPVRNAASGFFQPPEKERPAAPPPPRESVAWIRHQDAGAGFRLDAPPSFRSVPRAKGAHLALKRDEGGRAAHVSVYSTDRPAGQSEAEGLDAAIRAAEKDWDIESREPIESGYAAGRPSARLEFRWRNRKSGEVWSVRVQRFHVGGRAIQLNIWCHPEDTRKDRELFDRIQSTFRFEAPQD